MTRLPARVFPKVRVEQGLGILQKKGHKPLSEAETGRKIGKMLKASDKALAMGFRHAACGPLVSLFPVIVPLSLRCRKLEQSLS